MSEGYVPHIVQEGSRFHVLSYHGGNLGGWIKCSEPNCIENKHYEEQIKPKMIQI